MPGELHLLCHLEDPQQAQGSQDADAKGGSRLHCSPNHLKNAAHDDLQGQSTSERAQLLLSSLCCSQRASGIRVWAACYKKFRRILNQQIWKSSSQPPPQPEENTLGFIHREKFIAFFSSNQTTLKYLFLKDAVIFN